jgi:quercetin dioxygenase-like cupin family protein
MAAWARWYPGVRETVEGEGMKHLKREFWIGSLVGALTTVVIAGIAVEISGAAQTSATSVPKYAVKVLLDNDRVRVREVTFSPGVLDTGMHTHDLAHVGVILTKGALVFTEPGGKPENVAFEAGSVGFREANVTHQVGNPGTSPMRVIEVELK